MDFAAQGRIFHMAFDGYYLKQIQLPEVVKVNLTS